MDAAAPSASEALDRAIAAADDGELAGLDDLPVPVYFTDPAGRITYYNAACIAFAGRTPAIGVDCWCVTWKLFTTGGEYLPHDQCPMAVAIRDKRAVRGEEAVAERPDGSRVAFRPYPTPLLDADGQLIGAVNILVDVTNENEARFLQGQAERCRRLAQSVGDQQTATTLTLMADEYEEKVRALRR